MVRIIANMSKENNKKLSYCILISSLISFPITLRAEFILIPSLDLSAIYTDNVTLATQGQEESDFITRIAPGISARYRGSRTEFLLDYRLEHLMYAEDSDRNATFNLLEADFNTELVRDYFFIDADASIYQTVIDPQNPVFSNVQVTDNLTDANTAGISPYLLFPIFTVAQSELRYRYQYLDYDDETLSDTETQQIYFIARNLQRSRRFSWSMVYDKVRLEYRDAENGFYDEDAYLELNYRTTPNFALLGSVGQQKIEYFNVINVEDLSDSYWYAGFIWDFTRRTTLELRGGERYDDDTYYGRLASRTRFSNWALSYSEDITTAAQQQLENQAFEQTDSSGAPVENPEAANVNFGTAPIDNLEPFLEKRFDLNYTYGKGGNAVLISAYDLDREYLISRTLDTEYGGFARLDWQVQPRTILSFFGSYESLTREATDTTVVSRDIGLRATRQLANMISGFLEYRYNKAESEETMQTAEENIVEATLEMTF